MASDAQVREWSGTSRRRVPRFRVGAPLDVIVLRGGVSDTVPGRSVNVGERGIAAVLAGELVPGETVGVEVLLSPAAEPLRTKATVRYQDKLRCGFEFLAMSAEQRTAIRDWAKTAKAEPEASMAPASSANRVEVRKIQTGKGSFGGGGRGGRGKNRGRLWIVILALAVLVAAAFWWQWSRGWQELESGLKGSGAVSADKAKVQVPTEVMQRLLVHRVDPVYPLEARKQNLQGIIALDIVVSTDGTVTSMRALNGPDILAKAAMDSLRWWKFEPYRVNGKAVTAETTVAVEFKK